MADIVAVTVTRSWATAAMDIGSRSPITAIRSLTPIPIRRIRHTNTSGLTAMTVTPITATPGRATIAHDILVRDSIIDREGSFLRGMRGGRRRKRRLPRYL